MKPLVVYVDDEPMNLTVFEAAMPEDWEIQVFDSPLKALDALTKLNPCIVVSDQKMPGMVGVNFLEIVKRTHPSTKRVIATGYSEEDLVVDSIRKAGVHDYIKKPWDVEDLLHRLKSVMETYNLEKELFEKNSLLEKQNHELQKMTEDLKKAKAIEEQARKELEAWAPPFVLSAIQSNSLKFPMRRDLALICFDIINSSETHDITIDGASVRSVILKGFSESVLRQGGWRESHAGDSAYAHFGLLESTSNPVESALATATEFRSFLRALNLKYGLKIECGIGLHLAKDVSINLHEIEIQTLRGTIKQKSFDSTSPDVDLVHRLESFTHQLPGSNVAISESFAKVIIDKLPQAKDLGNFQLKGQKALTKIYLKPSDQVTEQQIIEIKEKSAASGDSLDKKTA
ncbi:MAG: response regulator [Pseudobdellovibrio sp.]|nr:response regulator [Pseudobdellovibrio sp.]